MTTDSGSKPPANVSRRAFLQGSGAAISAGAFIESALADARETLSSAPVAGSGPAEIELLVNGAKRKVYVEPRTTLSAALRNALNMTGTKVACDRGQCSACTVWIDGVPVLACMTLAIEVSGREVTTIEGLAKGEQLHPVQESFVEHDASQCGFCTPGMVMSCAALLTRNPNPTEQDVKNAISGNLCRCGTYPKVVKATVEAGKRMKSSGRV